MRTARGFPRPLPPFFVTPTATVTFKTEQLVRPGPPTPSPTKFLRACPSNEKIADLLLGKAKKLGKPTVVLYENTTYGLDLRDRINDSASQTGEFLKRKPRALALEMESPSNFAGHTVIVASSHERAKALIDKWQSTPNKENRLATTLFSDGAFFAEVVRELSFFESAFVVSLAPEEELRTYISSFREKYDGATPDGYGYWTWHYTSECIKSFCANQDPFAGIIDTNRPEGGSGIMSLNTVGPSLLPYEVASDLLARTSDTAR